MHPLERLFLLLEREGIRVPLDVRLRVQRILQERQEDFLAHPEDLKWVIGPMIAKSQKDQEAFGRLFDLYLKQVLEDAKEDAGIHIPGFREFREKVNWRRVLLRSLLVLLPLLVGIAVLFWRTTPEERKLPPQTYWEARFNNRGDSLSLVNQTPNLWNQNSFSWELKKITDSLLTVRDTTLSLEDYIAGIPSDSVITFNTKDTTLFVNDLQQGLWYITLTGQSKIGFADKPYGRAVRINSVPDPTEVFETGATGRIELPTPGAKTLDADAEYGSIWRSAIVIAYIVLLPLLLGLFLAWLYRRIIRGGLFRPKMDIDFIGGTGPPYRIPFRNRDPDIRPTETQYGVASLLRQRTEGQVKKLQVKESVKRTIRNMGNPTLVYKEVSRAAEYLVLIQHSAYENHLVRLFTYLNDFYKSEDVYLEYFYYDTDPRICWNAQNPNGIAIEQLLQTRSQYRLLLIGDGHSLVQSFPVRRFQPWVEPMLGGWKQRALLSTVPVSEWGYHEEILDRYFALLPAHLEGQLYLIEHLAFPDSVTMPRTVKQFNPAKGFTPKLRTLDNLRKHFSPSELLWLATLALHDEVFWELTLALGSTTEEYEQSRNRLTDSLLTFERLYRMSGLPWFEGNRMEEGIRSELLSLLDEEPELRNRARRTIIEVFGEVRVGKDSFASGRQDQVRELQSALLAPRLSRSRRILNTLKDQNLLNIFQARRFARYLAPPIWSWRSWPVFALILAPILIFIGMRSDQFFAPWYLEDREVQWLEERGYLNSLLENGWVSGEVDSIALLNNQAARNMTGRNLDEAGNLLKAARSLLDQQEVSPLNQSVSKLLAINYNEQLLEYYYGLLAYDSLNYESAAERFRQTIQYDSLAAHSSHNLGVISFYQGDRFQAFAIRDALMENAPGYFDSFEPNLNTLLEGLDPEEVKPTFAGIRQLIADNRILDAFDALMEMARADRQFGSQFTRTLQVLKKEMEGLGLRRGNENPDATEEDKRALGRTFLQLIERWEGMLEPPRRRLEAASTPSVTGPAQRNVDSAREVSEVVPGQGAKESFNGYHIIEIKGRSSGSSLRVNDRLSISMRRIPSGSFWMGDANSKYDEEGPIHRVDIGDGFSLSETEITNAQYCVFLNEAGNQEEGGVTWLDIEAEDSGIELRKGTYVPKSGKANHPVVMVSWYGARAFCSWAGGRLPSESEWEWAARGGEEYTYAGSEDLDAVGWYADNADNIQEVGQKRSNGFGLYDMSGNVWEWVEDPWHESYEGAPGSGGVWFQGEDSSRRVLRGGSWLINAVNARVAYRSRSDPGHRYNYIGFRLAHSLSGSSAAAE